MTIIDPLQLFRSGQKRQNEEKEGGEEASGGRGLRAVRRHGADDRAGPPGPPGHLSVPVPAGEIHHGETPPPTATPDLNAAP